MPRWPSKQPARAVPQAHGLTQPATQPRGVSIAARIEAAASQAADLSARLQSFVDRMAGSGNPKVAREEPSPRPSASVLDRQEQAIDRLEYALTVTAAHLDAAEQA